MTDNVVQLKPRPLSDEQMQELAYTILERMVGALPPAISEEDFDAVMERVFKEASEYCCGRISRRGKFDFGRASMRDKIRERGSEDVAGKKPSDLSWQSWRAGRTAPVERAAPTKQELRIEATRAFEAWRATRTSS